LLDTDALTFTGGTTIEGDLTVDTNTLYVDSTNNNIGVGVSSPSYPMTIASASNAVGLAINGRSADGLGAAYWFANNGTTQHGDIRASASEFRISSTPASAVQTFYTNGSERLRILSSGGITFNGDTAAANALDDYEEGTFTPTSTTNSGTAATFGTAQGAYTKIGNVVHFSLDVTNIDTTGTTSSSGFRIDGLPFTVDVDGTRAVVLWDNITFQGTRTSCVATISTAEYIQLNSMGTGISDTAVDYGDLSSGVTDVFICGFYYTDQ
jgi:hypothetical protein